MDNVNQASREPQTPADGVTIPYGELAPAIVEQLTAQLPAAQLAQAQVELATQRAAGDALSRRLLEAREHQAALERVIDSQAQLLQAQRDRLADLERVAHRAGVVLDQAGSQTWLKVGDPVVNLAKREQRLQEHPVDVDLDPGAVVLVDRMALDRLAEELRASQIVDADVVDVDEGPEEDPHG